MSGVGRPRVKIPEDFEHYYHLWKQGKTKGVDCMYYLNLTRSNFCRMVQAHESTHTMYDHQSKPQQEVIIVEGKNDSSCASNEDYNMSLSPHNTNISNESGDSDLVKRVKLITARRIAAYNKDKNS